MPDPRDLVNVSGRPLIQEKKLIALKVPRGIRIDPKLYTDISRLTGCAVIELPMDCEVMMGELAGKELVSLHHAIHAILGQPDFSPDESEIKVLYSAMRFLCEKTHPSDGSAEVHLMKKLKPFAVEQENHNVPK